MARSLAQTSTYDRTTLPSGLQVLTSTLPHTKAVSIIFMFGAGSRYETDDLAGASHLFEHVLFKGTQRRPTPREISDVVEGVGGSLNAYTDREMTGYWCRIARPHYKNGLDVLADMTRNSLLREEDIEREKQVVYEEIRASHDSPAGRVDEILDGLMWPEQPMGRDIAGSIESVKAISRDAMVQYLHTQYVASNMVLAVAGDISHEEVVQQAEELLGDWHDGKPLPMFPFVDNLKGPSFQVEFRDTEQAHLAIGLHGLSMFDEDRYALSLLSVVLGESMSSRLFEEVREKRGLAYAIHSGVSQYRDCGAVHIESGVDPSRAESAVEVIMEQLAKLRDGVSEEEFHKAKELSKGRLLLRMEDSRAVASSIGAQQLLRGEVKTVDEIVEELEAVQIEDVDRIARTLIRSGKLASAIVGPFRAPEPFERLLKL